MFSIEMISEWFDNIRYAAEVVIIIIIIIIIQIKHHVRCVNRKGKQQWNKNHKKTQKLM